MNPDHVCEQNYKRLLQLLKGIDQSDHYQSDATVDLDEERQLRVSVAARDATERASHIVLKLSNKGESGDPESGRTMEIQFYHSIALAVPFSCSDYDGYRCAQNERGHVLSVRVSELNVVLVNWLRELGRLGVSLSGEPVVRAA